MRYLISTVLSILPLGLPSGAWADTPRVITDIAPVYSLVSMVMGDLGQPVLLLDKGASAHDFQLRPSQMRDIAGADLAFWIGPSMTPWFERALQGADTEITSIALIDIENTARYDFGAWQAGDDRGHGDHGHEAKGEHAHTGTDPHAWLNPDNAALWLDAIALTLSAKDSANAARYAANAQAARAEIAAMDKDLAAQLGPVQGRAFVTYHDAYHYFAAHYGLAYHGAIALGDASSAGAAHLRAMQETMAQDKIICVFPESQHDSSLLVQLTAGTGAKAGGALDPEGATLDANRHSYTDLMRKMATTLAECLGGA